MTGFWVLYLMFWVSGEPKAEPVNMIVGLYQMHGSHGGCDEARQGILRGHVIDPDLIRCEYNLLQEGGVTMLDGTSPGK